MRIVNEGNVGEPLVNPSGERIYELVGASAETGGAQKHSVALVVLPPGKSSDEHYHRVSEETYFILRGTARMVIDGQTFRLAPGQACWIEPRERHRIFNDGEQALEFLAVCAPPWTPDDSTFV